MERLFDEELKEQKFACDCGHMEFDQECFVRTYEIIEVYKKEDGTIYLVSKSLHEMNEDDIEYTATFTCPKCGAEYSVVQQDGRDAICKNE